MHVWTTHWHIQPEAWCFKETFLATKVLEHVFKGGNTSHFVHGLSRLTFVSYDDILLWLTTTAPNPMYFPLRFYITIHWEMTLKQHWFNQGLYGVLFVCLCWVMSNEPVSVSVPRTSDEYLWEREKNICDLIWWFHRPLGHEKRESS
jgi:hypothetical protein